MGHMYKHEQNTFLYMSYFGKYICCTHYYSIVAFLLTYTLPFVGPLFGDTKGWSDVIDL